MLTEQPKFVPGMSGSGIHSNVRRFVQEHALYRQRGFVLAEDWKYLTGMVTFIEKEFGIHVLSCEVTEENLGSPRAVARFVASKHPF
jgi:hypothetical protein